MCVTVVLGESHILKNSVRFQFKLQSCHAKRKETKIKPKKNIKIISAHPDLQSNMLPNEGMCALCKSNLYSKNSKEEQNVH